MTTRHPTSKRTSIGVRNSPEDLICEAEVSFPDSNLDTNSDQRLPLKYGDFARP